MTHTPCPICGSTQIIESGHAYGYCCAKCGAEPNNAANKSREDAEKRWEDFAKEKANVTSNKG